MEGGIPDHAWHALAAIVSRDARQPLARTTGTGVAVRSRSTAPERRVRSGTERAPAPGSR